MKDHALMTTDEAAEVCRTTPGTLEQWRHRGEGPQFVKLGRAVRYRRADLDAWIESRVQNKTGEQS